jgi:hypothetical protein
MAKGQKRTNREPKKKKGAEKSAKKQSGPKYLRQTESPLSASLGAQKIGQKRV